MIYRSKVDPWLPMVLLLPILLPLAIGLTILTSGSAPAPLGWMILLVSPGVVLLLLLVGWPATYDPEATRADGEPILRVRSGYLVRYDVPLAQITEVKPSRNPGGSPAWSLDRLEIVYPTASGLHRSLLISPRDRDAFLDELARRAGNLGRVGDRLTRKHDTHAAP
jgi:hypothetical protein